MLESSLTVAARIIGCICLVGSTMISTQIAIDLWHCTDPAYTNSTLWSFQALELWSTQDSHQKLNYQKHLLTIGAYVVGYGICSGLLVYATFMGNQMLAMPWLFSEGACVLCEVVAMVNYAMHPNQAKAAAPGVWKTADQKFNVAGAFLCLAVSVGMWMVVYKAQRSWKSLPQTPILSSPPSYALTTLEQPRPRLANGTVCARALAAPMSIV